MKISHAMELHKNFGFDVAFSSVCASLSKYASDYRNENILRYLKEEYKDFIGEYQRKSYDANAKNNNSKIPSGIFFVAKIVASSHIPP